MSQLQLAPRLASIPSVEHKTTPSRTEVHQKIESFTQASSILGYMSFVIDIALYAFGIFGVLMFDGIVSKFIGGLFIGFGVIGLGSLSHEAAHRSLVKSRLGNHLISVVAFTMILFNYRLWIYDHHVLHHARTNVKNNNFLSPLTLAEYQGMSRFRRALYRAYHSDSGLGILLYYLLERWPGVHFYPGSWLPKRFHASAWRYTALEAGFIIAVVSGLVFVATARNESIIAAVGFGFVLPYMVWFFVFSMTAFLQHTNPQLRWYKDVASVTSPPEALSVEVLIPSILNHTTHYVLVHQVHHVSAKIPHYRLKKAQAALAGISDPSIFTMRYTFANMRDVLRRCRLYDYDKHVWINFKGEVTAIPVETALSRQANDSAQPFDDSISGDAAKNGSSGIFFSTERSLQNVQDSANSESQKASNLVSE